MKVAALIVMFIFILSSALVFAADMSDIIPVLKSAKKNIDSTLADLDKDIKIAAQGLSGMDLRGEEARKILIELRKFRPYAINCAIIDANGIQITVEPSEYKQYENIDRTELPYVIQLLKTGRPVMSNVYKSAEGINAVSIGHPIFSAKGELMGLVRMLIKYELFLKGLAEDKPCKIWIMQPNGLIVYDPDPEQIGKNIFSDEVFKPFEDLISFSKTVALSRSGAGSYSFYADGIRGKDLAEKVAAWDTAGLHGTEWRVIAMEIDRKIEQPSAAK